jgi:hypothetical protein
MRTTALRQERSFHKYYTNMYCIGRECGHREWNPSLQLQGSGRRKTMEQYPGDRYFRRKTRARRLEAAGLCLVSTIVPRLPGLRPPVVRPLG